MSHQAPLLLNDDGSASVATALLMSHHGFRRDIALFATALQKLSAGDGARATALQEAWKSYQGTLHGHHESEDQRLFPFLREQHPSLAPVIDQLGADHRRIDPLLERGEQAFASLPDVAPALAVVTELATLLDAHLATEEAQVVAFLRELKQFPGPESDAEAELYAQGFAWSSHGVAQEVLDRVDALLPASLAARLPAARAAYQERCLRLWGAARAGASRTAIPDWLPGG